MSSREQEKSVRSIFPVCVLALLSALSVPTQAQSDADRNAIDALLERHTEKWNAHDMDAWAEILHEDADWVHWRGGIWRGKAQIREGHREIHRTYYKATRMSAQRIEDLTFLTPEIALAHVRSEMTGDERSPGETFQYRKTFVFTKKSGVWRVRALHNTRIP
jgi:uncharacterized protein (TIGR02246 family)